MRKIVVGDKVRIIDNEVQSFNEWGIVKQIDIDGYYHVAIANSEDQALLFDASQIKRLPLKNK